MTAAAERDAQPEGPSLCQVTTVHRRDDIRIARKECRSLASAFPGRVRLLVADGKGDSPAVTFDTFDMVRTRRSRWVRISRSAWTALRAVRRHAPRVVHIHDPELLPAAYALKLMGYTLIYDVHEDVPRQIATKHWIPRFARRLSAWAFERFEEFVAKRIDGIVTATPHIAARFRRLNRNTVDVNNFPWPEELAPPIGGSVRKRQVCYVGGISEIRGIQQLIEALPYVPDVRLVLCGDFSGPRLRERLEALEGWNQVDYRGHVDRAELQVVMAECVAGVVTFLPAPNHVDAQPNKMFEYMSAQLPVIGSHFAAWRDIIETSGCGICVDPLAPAEIASAIRRLADDPLLVSAMGAAGREAVLTKYNWPAEARKLIAFYEKLL